MENTYDELKRAILCRTVESESSCLRQLLNSEELRNRRPMQLLHRMCQFLGERPSETQSKLLGELFIQRLLTNISMMFASAFTMPLDALAELADCIAEHVLPETVAETAFASSSVSLEVRLQELAEAVHALQFVNPERSLSPR